MAGNLPSAVDIKDGRASVTQELPRTNFKFRARFTFLDSRIEDFNSRFRSSTRLEYSRGCLELKMEEQSRAIDWELNGAINYRYDFELSKHVTSSNVDDHIIQHKVFRENDAAACIRSEKNKEKVILTISCEDLVDSLNEAQRNAIHGKSIPITESEIRCILGLPIGGIDIGSLLLKGKNRPKVEKKLDIKFRVDNMTPIIPLKRSLLGLELAGGFEFNSRHGLLLTKYRGNWSKGNDGGLENDVAMFMSTMVGSLPPMVGSRETPSFDFEATKPSKLTSLESAICTLDNRKVLDPTKSSPRSSSICQVKF
ncbi:hypothetical protein M9H77_07704 [Catharanthus roseus]|uniref:Uncharacterized protein n=1 Tax=Catharanthus roseus TaxID=4058 RepID=A0ACC0BVZ1_CATRO|nr:hypothetical protein M9H77_07704 [Catharanthus roseus]